MNPVGQLGRGVITKWRQLRGLVALLVTVAWLALHPRYWRATVRDVLVRQVLFTGVEAVRFISLIALLVGMSIVLQAQLWLTKFGQSALLGPLLVAVIIREVGPLLTNFVVIGRSGAAIAAELGNMRVSGEVRVLDAQGLDPLPYLVLPRVVGMGISVFCLTLVFIGVSLFSGYVSGMLLGVTTVSPGMFTTSVFKAVSPSDVVNVIAKTLIPGMLTGAICCQEGLSVERSITEVPQATTRGLVRSVMALFITSALVSLLTYM
ncbi:MAG: ABC transporter permease [Spartobacteria bacterium]|nr:ABC transporter permease [Spartobacteria bacterium]